MCGSNAPPPSTPLVSLARSLPPSRSRYTTTTTNSTHCLFPLRCGPTEATAVNPSSVDWKPEKKIRATRHCDFLAQKNNRHRQRPLSSVRFCTRRRQPRRQNGKDPLQLSLNRCKYTRDGRYFRYCCASDHSGVQRAFMVPRRSGNALTVSWSKPLLIKQSHGCQCGPRSGLLGSVR